jgi:twinkle protein
LIKSVIPWPVKGLFGADHFSEQVASLYDKGMVRGESTGYRGVDDIYTVMPGQLSIVTGIPSMGKSAFVDQVMVNLAKAKDWKFSVCSFENEPRIHIAKLAALYANKPFFDGPTPRMTKDEAAQAQVWINDHFSFLFQGDGHQSTIEDIIDRLRSAVMRYGIRGAVIDPANFVDRDRNMSETDWVSDALTKLKVFAMAHDLHIWFVAHPMKLRRGDDGKYAVPGGYDISGSSHWFNKADMGITVHRPDLGLSTSEIHVWKSRFNWIGRVGKAALHYDVPTGSYYEHHNPRLGDPF